MMLDSVGLAAMVVLQIVHYVHSGRARRRARELERLRVRALIVCDRLEREGRQLADATRDELEALSEALHALDP
jgi:hypothetical protein